jgi:hypothetical protein
VWSQVRQQVRSAIRRRIRALSLPPIVVVAACSSADATGPLMDPPTLALWDAVGVCTVAGELSNGETRVIAVPHGHLPISPLRTSDNKGSARAVYTIATGRMPRSVSGLPVTISVACLTDVREADIVRQQLMATPGNAAWRGIVQAIERGAPINSRNGLDAAVAGLRTIMGERRSQPTPTSSGFKLGGGMFNDPPYTLPPIYVFAYSQGYVFDMNSMYWGALTHPFYTGGPYPEYHYPSEDCAEASAFYLAKEEEEDKLEEYLDMMKSTADALEGLACENRPERICIDLFIMNARTLIFGGDDRQFDPNAGITSSRVHLYIDPESLTWHPMFNGSTILDFKGNVVHASGAGTHFRPEDIVIWGVPTAFTVHAQFYNSYCPTRLGCPAINISVTFTQDHTKPGGYAVDWSRDGFPSMGVYTKTEANWQTMSTIHGGPAEDAEKIKSPWLNWLNLIPAFKNSVPLPPGCNLQ